VRTKDGTATAGEDFDKLDEILEFKADEPIKEISIKIVDDEDWEPDEDFYVELYDLKTGEVLEGTDVVATVIIIDNDKPGVFSFEKTTFTYAEDKNFAEIIVTRSDGCDGVSNIIIIF
jgi:solute carrier family 8 (sodium/calcium exchanger)